MLPEQGRPTCERVGEYIICSHVSQFRQKPLDGAIAVGEVTTCQQGQSLASVAA